MRYKPVEFPFETTDFYSLNAKQAKEFFEFYIKEIPGRMEFLREYLLYDGVEIDFDYSPESLITLWAWYLSKVKIRKKSKMELIMEASKHPRWMKESIMEDMYDVSTGDVYFWDVAIYFAEVIVRNNPAIHWGYFTKPKNYVSVNRPVLVGFKNNMDMDPNLIVDNLSGGIARKGKNERALYELYYVWQEFVNNF